MRQLILVAAHDDGSGAHVTLFHLCRALLERFRTHDSACLTRFQNPASAFELIAEKLDSPLNAGMVARMGMIPFGVENPLADYLSTFSPPCLAPSPTSIPSDTEPHLVSHLVSHLVDPTFVRDEVRDKVRD